MIQLTPMQQQIVNSQHPLVVVEAQPGSGKTRVLVERLKGAFKVHGLLAGQVVAITFTEKAAQEIKNRLLSDIQMESNSLWISTIHGFCMKILQRHLWQADLGLQISVLGAEQALYFKKIAIEEGIQDIIAQNDASQIQLLKDYGFTRIRSLLMHQLNQPSSVLSQTSDIHPTVVKLKKLVAYIWGIYDAKKEGQLDFNDLLSKCLGLLKKHPDILKQYRNKFKLIMVDEFQDTDHIQNEIITLLTSKQGIGGRPKLVVVGDPKQSIYRFRGAQVNIFHSLRDDALKQEGFCFQMVENFRSQKKLIEFTNRLFEPLLSDTFVASEVADLKTQDTSGGVEYWHYEPKDAQKKWNSLEGRLLESKWLAQKIKADQKKWEKKTSIAVLFRAMTYAHLYEKAFQAEGLQCVRSDAGQLFLHKTVQELLALLTWAISPEDEFSLWRVLNASWSGLGTPSKLWLTSHRAQTGCRLMSALEAGTDKKDIQVFLKKLKQLRWLKGRVCLEVWFSHLSFEPSAAVDRFFHILREFEKQHVDSSWSDILQYIGVISESKISKSSVLEEVNPGVIQLMSIHQSKGLEFDWVYLPDLSYVARNELPLLLADKESKVGLKNFENMRLVGEDDLYKELKELEKQKEIEERKRLFYVAITRAKSRLILSHAAKKPQKNSWAGWIDQHKLILEKNMREAVFK